jgi:hypothetical protein
MALRRVSAGVYVTDGGQFIISFARSGRRAFLVPACTAEQYVTSSDRLKLVLVALVTGSFGAVALKLVSPVWILPAAAVPFLAVWWVRREIAEQFPRLADPQTIAEIAARNEGSEPAWFPLVSIAIFGIMAWVDRHPRSSRLAELAIGVTLILTVLEFAVTRRAHAAHQSDRPSSAITL